VKVEPHLKDAVAKGARVVARGKRPQAQFFEPIVVVDSTADVLRAQGDLRPLRAHLQVQEGAASHSRREQSEAPQHERNRVSRSKLAG
jgi:hypothetical protein